MALTINYLCLTFAYSLFVFLCSSSISCLGYQWKDCRPCLGYQWEYCGSVPACAYSFAYPFGISGSGCGDPQFQLQCTDMGFLLNINGNDYQILEPSSLANNSNHRMTIVNDYMFREDLCNISDNYTMWWSDSQFFHIVHGYTKVTFWNDCATDWLEKNSTFTGMLNSCDDFWYYYSSPKLDSIAEQFCKTHLQLPINMSMLDQHVITNMSMLDQGFEITWDVDPNRYQSCSACLISDGSCGHDIYAPFAFLCYCPDGSAYPNTCADPHGGKNKSAIVIGWSIGGAALTAIAVALLTFYLKRGKHSLPHRGSSTSKVEKFLKEYAYEMPTRYSQSRLKKITNNYAEKLGEGGYGVVYKGKLPNDVLVAVKLLDRHRHSETQFMNEVAAIGLVHHVNLVRLLGYCFETPTSALVYEYMVNGSLEKFIFAGKEKGQILGWEQLHSIALGTARGIAYLHQDCEKRIIHFDIKPHNILLDSDFTPKVADFGLAKLCVKEVDHLSMTAARGTPGYVAPEVCDGNLGHVTDKSDVYSFGMLLLEIVGGRKNFDWRVSRSSQYYFPEWVFKVLDSGELALRLRGEEETEAEDEEKARRLTKVGLWCIQYNYRDRPCMNRVVQMLEGIGDDVSNPPLPINSSTTIQNTFENPLLSST